MIKEAIITGATGVIGMALIKKNIENGIRTVVVVNPESSRLDRIPKHDLVDIKKCSIENYRDLDADELGINKDKCKDICLYHLAWKGTFGEARNDSKLQSSNVEYTLEAVRLASRIGCNCFIGVGSQAEYGRVEGILCDDTPCNPENEYGRAKLRAGQESRKLCQELGIRHIWARVLSVYGPYDGEATMVTSTINKLLDGKVPELTAGEQMWDYLYSEDAATALMLLSDKGLDGQVYPLGSGIARPLREYIEIMRDAINPKQELGFGTIPYSDKQVMYLCADISGLCKDTGFEVSTSFERGISNTIDYLEKIRRQRQ